jgi:hypothetical protein
MTGPRCPICDRWLTEDDHASELWPVSSKLGPVHRECQAEAAAGYEEWLNDQREADAHEANQREANL